MPKFVYKKLKCIINGTETKKELEGMLNDFLNGNISSLFYKHEADGIKYLLPLTLIGQNQGNTALIFNGILGAMSAITQASVILSDTPQFVAPVTIGGFTPVDSE